MSSNDTSTPSPAVSWESIEAFARGKVQQFLQHILEDEVTALLGRQRSERRSAVDPIAGYRNGLGKPRRLAMQGGTITLRRPRLRGLEARFESKILPLFARRTKELGALLPELYLHGLSLGDFVFAPRGMLERYYAHQGGRYSKKPAPERIFPKFIYTGEVQVMVNKDPQL